MDHPTREQVAKLQNSYWDVMEENAELKTSVMEKDEIIARLRRQMNTANHKVAKLQQLVEPEMFLASR